MLVKHVLAITHLSPILFWIFRVFERENIYQWQMMSFWEVFSLSNIPFSKTIKALFTSSLVVSCMVIAILTLYLVSVTLMIEILAYGLYVLTWLDLWSIDSEKKRTNSDENAEKNFFWIFFEKLKKNEKKFFHPKKDQRPKKYSWIKKISRQLP